MSKSGTKLTRISTTDTSTACSCKEHARCVPSLMTHPKYCTPAQHLSVSTRAHTPAAHCTQNKHARSLHPMPTAEDRGSSQTQSQSRWLGSWQFPPAAPVPVGQTCPNWMPQCCHPRPTPSCTCTIAHVCTCHVLMSCMAVHSCHLQTTVVYVKHGSSWSLSIAPYL